MGVIITFIYRNKNHISEMKSLLGDTKLSLADVGAAGGLDKRWHFLRPTNLTEILFEPDPASFKELQNKSLPNTLVFNAALSKNIISPESADRFLNSIKKEFLFPDFKGKKSLKGILDFASKHLNENVFSTHTDQKLGN